MKQLISRQDSRVRLIGIEEAETKDGYIRFKMPIGECMWNGRDWMLSDEQEKGEKTAFCEKLRKAIKAKGYSAMGLSQSLGHSGSWLANIIGGRVRLKTKHDSSLEAELGLAPGTLKRWRR